MTRDLTRQQLWRGLLLAYGLHLLILFLFVLDVIPQQYHAAGRPFWLHHGGDNVGYFNLARDLLRGDLQPNKYPLGFPLLLTPFIVLFQPHDQQDLLELVSAFWGIVMFPLGQVILAWLARRLSGKRWLALLSVLLWTALPLAMYYGLRLVVSLETAEVSAVHLMWAQMLSDGPATLFTLLLLAAYFYGRERAAALRQGALLGALGGFLLLIRLTGALSVGLVGLLLLLDRRWRVLAVMLPVTLLVFAPQMIYNARFFGAPLTTGYQVLDAIPAAGLFSLNYLTGAVAGAWAQIGVLLLAMALALLALAAVGLRYLWRQDRRGALAVGLWLASYAGFYSIYYYSWEGGLARFMMPAYPAGAVLLAGVLGALAARRNRDELLPSGSLPG